MDSNIAQKAFVLLISWTLSYVFLNIDEKARGSLTVKTSNNYFSKQIKRIYSIYYCNHHKVIVTKIRITLNIIKTTIKEKFTGLWFIFETSNISNFCKQNCCK